MSNFLHCITYHDEVKLLYPEGTKPSGTDFTVNYHTLNGNNPQQRNDYIGLWKSSGGGRLPAGANALASYPVNIANTDSNKTLLDLPIDQNEYVLGYCHGADPKTKKVSVSATLSIPAGKFEPDKAVTQSVKLNLKGDEASIWLEYTAILGTNPKSCQNWVGIWQGNDLGSMSGCVPVFSQHTSSTSASGKMAFDSVLRRGTAYMLCYFLDGLDPDTGAMNYNKLAAYLFFDTDE